MPQTIESSGPAAEACNPLWRGMQVFTLISPAERAIPCNIEPQRAAECAEPTVWLDAISRDHLCQHFARHLERGELLVDSNKLDRQTLLKPWRSDGLVGDAW